MLAQAESGKLPLAHQLVELDTLMLEVMNEMQCPGERDKLKLKWARSTRFWCVEIGIVSRGAAQPDRQRY